TTPSTTTTPSGATLSGSATGGAGASAAAKGRPFVALEELAGLPRMNAGLFAAARPYLTPYGDSAEPDPKIAPPPIKRALEAVHRSGTGTSTPTPAPGMPTDQAQPQANGAAAGFQVIDAGGNAPGTQGTANAIFRIVAIVKTG